MRYLNPFLSGPTQPRVKRILIVDDHAISVEILIAVLEEEYELATASSGEEALQIAADFHPDFILLDVVLPGMDGCETCRVIKSEPILHDSRVVMTSAKAMKEDCERGLLAGADVYLTKPFDQNALLAELRR